MEPSSFDRLRRKGRSRFTAMTCLCLFILLVSGLLIAVGVFFTPPDGVAFAAIGGVFALYGLIMLTLFGRKYLTRRRRVRQRYQALSPSQQREIEADLDGCDRLKICLFCAHYMYFPDQSGLGVFTFLPYSEIAWAYVKTSITPMAGSDNRPEDSVFPGRASIIHIYDRAGRRYMLNGMDVNRMGMTLLSQISERAPKAVIGYTKERKRQAKVDISAIR